MSPQYSRYLSEPRGPNIPDSMISENPMTALSGVRNSWLILARNFDFAWLASSARVFSSEYFSARSASSSAWRSSANCDLRRSETAFLCAPLADIEPAPVFKLRLEGACTGRAAFAGDLGTHDGHATTGHDVFI